MNNLAHIIQLIATAVNTRMTMTLSQRIAMMAAQMHKGGGTGKSWMERHLPRINTLSRRRDKAEDDYYKSLHNSFVRKAEGASNKEIERLIKSTIKLKEKFEDLAKQTEDLKQDSKQKDVYEKAAASRQHSSPTGRVLRQARYVFKRLIGKAGRDRLKLGVERFGKLKNSLDPVKNQRRREDARVAYRQAEERRKIAQKTHEVAKEAHTANPTAQTAKRVIQAAAAEEAATAAAQTAKSLLSVAEAAGFLAIELPGIGLAIGAVIGTIGAVIATVSNKVQQQLREAEQEISRFRKERSTYNGTIANAITRYDRQSMMLEERSSRATAGSAQGVVESTMSLREAGQSRSERWENLGNTIMALRNDVATGASRLLEMLDFLPGAIQGMIDIGKWAAEKLGIELTKIEKNTRHEASIGIQAVQGFHAGITGQKPKAIQPLK